jgi:hypothetical protein
MANSEHLVQGGFEDSDPKINDRCHDWNTLQDGCRHSTYQK